MSDDRSLPLGKTVWHDLMTTDLAKALRYYQDLFGWEIKSVDMGPAGTYPMVHVAGDDWGGFVELDASHRGIPSHWVPYVVVESVDRAVELAERLGGKVAVPGRDIPGVGRFAVVVDPTGGVSSPFRPEKPAGEGYQGLPRPGTFCWEELLATDPESAALFYGEVYDWKVISQEQPGMGTYHHWKRGDKDAGGMLHKPAGTGPSAWLPYIAVDDVEAKAARVRELGGKVLREAAEVPGIGRFAVTADPTGAIVGLFKP
ncbi:MAG: VOC family protein [Acidobacteriota bacterium]|nr:VOC family protein [Acidobacteriota bacterium]